MSLLDTVLYVQSVIRGITGIASAPVYPSEGTGTFPFAVTHAENGIFEFGPGGGIKGLHTITVEIHWARKDLPHDIEVAMPYGDLVPAALLADPTLGGTASTFERVRYTFGMIGWGDLQTIGWKFFIENVKILT